MRVGGHLTLAGKELQKTSNPVGGGPDVLLAGGPLNWPVMIGFQFGLDWFGSRTERFTFDGQTTNWDIDRLSYWGHGLLRFTPTRGTWRPTLDLLGGFWGHDVTIDRDFDLSDDDDPYSLGTSYTGSYGFGVGLDWVGDGGGLVSLSLIHLRGGKIQVPDVRNVEVVDNVLYYGEASASGIHQWMFLLNVGGITKNHR